MVEMLVAIVLLQLGILALAAVMPLTQAQVVRSGHETAANQLLRSRMETLVRASYSDSTLAAGTYNDSGNPIDGVFARSWTIADDTPVSGCKTVTVTVAWNNSNGPRTIQASTVVSKY